MNDGEKRTTRLYAWIAKDLHGIEGIVTVPSRDGMLPLVETDEDKARKFKEFAAMAGTGRLSLAELVVFERKNVLDTT